MIYAEELLWGHFPTTDMPRISVARMPLELLPLGSVCASRSRANLGAGWVEEYLNYVCQFWARDSL